jgi:hypothetical protein
MEYGTQNLYEQPKQPQVSLRAAMQKKDKERQEIESLTALYLASGGKISRHEPQERQAWKPLNERQ